MHENILHTIVCMCQFSDLARLAASSSLQYSVLCICIMSINGNIAIKELAVLNEWLQGPQ